MLASGSIPKHATFTRGGLPVGLDSRRRNVRLTPQAGPGPYNDRTSNIIRIDIPPSVGFLDCNTSYLRFRVKVTNADTGIETGYVRMDENCLSWCHRFEVISNNGSVLESIENYNLLSNLLHSATSPNDYRSTAGKLLDNQGSKAERNANMAGTDGKMYCTGLDASGIFGGNSKYLPCQFIQGSLTLVFHLAAFDECFANAAIARGSYIISDVEYVAECLQFGQDFNMVFEQQLRTAGVDISYHTYRAHNQSLTSAKDQTIQISQNSKSVKGCYCVIRDAQKYRSSNFDSLSTYKSANIQEYQFDLGGRLFPEGRLQCDGGKYANAYASNLNSFNHFRDHAGGSQIDRSTFNAVQNESLHGCGRDRAGVGGTAPAYQGNPMKRMYGKICSGVEFFDALNNGAVAEHVINGFSFGTVFQPDDLDDIASFKLGERYKVTTKTNLTLAAGDSAEQASIAGPGVYHLETVLGVAETNQDKLHTYLYCVGHGEFQVPILGTIADKSVQTAQATIPGCVFFASKLVTVDEGRHLPAGGPAHAQVCTSVIKIDGTFANNKANDSSTANVIGAGSLINLNDDRAADDKLPTPTSASEFMKKDAVFDMHTGGGDKGRLFWNTCILDQIPDDSKFYMGMSFETHDEHENMVSGTDLTNTVPLHLNMKFSSDTGCQEQVKMGDVITSFVHYDCVLRIEPDGNVISSM